MGQYHPKKTSIFALATGLFLASCGARTKSASEVEGIFKKDNQTLGLVVTDLCQKLRTREKIPNMSRAALSDAECGLAGKSADNYKTVEKQFHFEGLTKEINQESGKDVLHIRTRAKVWLNSGILDLALKLTKALKERANGGEDIFSKPDNSGSGEKLDNLVKVTTKELQRVQFNQADRTFAGRINISGNGLVKLNNDIEIHGQIFSDSIGININSSKEADFKDSLIKDVSATGIVTPYAGDVYVDLVFEINIHSIGLNGLLFDKINSALGSALKTILDTMLKLK